MKRVGGLTATNTIRRAPHESSAVGSKGRIPADEILESDPVSDGDYLTGIRGSYCDVETGCRVSGISSNVGFLGPIRIYLHVIALASILDLP